MIKYTLILSFIFCIVFPNAFSQRLGMYDTLFVFTLLNDARTDTVGFKYLDKGSKVVWNDYENQAHEATINAICKDSILFDAEWVPLYQITSITRKSMRMDDTGIGPGFNPVQGMGTILINGRQQTMRRLEYEHLLRAWKFNVALKAKIASMERAQFPQKNIDKYLEVTTKRFETDEAKIAYKYAIRDTTRAQYDSLYGKTRYYSHEYNRKRKDRRYIEYLRPHSITLDVIEPLANQITLTYGYRVCRWFGIEIAPGIYFRTQDRSPIVPNITYIQHCPGLNYNHWRNQGYQLNITCKFYLPGKPNRYIGLKLFGRDLSFPRETIGTYVLYHDSAPLTAISSENGSAYGFALIYGWQLTHFQHWTFDFYFGLGAYYRSGDVTFYHGRVPGVSFNETVTFPYQYSTAAWFTSIQGGMKIGFRWGKRKIGDKQ